MLFLIAGAALMPSLLTLGQPIVENYVGRQVPTAMVARNLDRGSGFLRPELDTGPFPSLFLVEPPIYATAVVGVSRITRLEIREAGRLTSTIAAGLAAIGLCGLVSRRRDLGAGLLASALFLWLPISLRYGRAVQPDMLALGLATLGLDAWDRWARNGRARWAAIGWSLVTLALATRVLWAFVLIPLGMVLESRSSLGRSPWRRMVVLVSHLGLAAAWYAYAAPLAAGSAAALATAREWSTAVGPAALLDFETWRWIGRFGLIRAFTPLGVWLTLMAIGWRSVDRVWLGWLAGALATLVLVSGKLHHEYYWLLAAPAVAEVGAAAILRYLDAARWERRVPMVATGLTLCQIGLGVGLAWSTWETPEEWSTLPLAADAIAGLPADGLTIAREAVLYHGDRRGMRLEQEPAALRRALAEWGLKVDERDATPEKALNWYHQHGARAFAEVGDPAVGPLHTEWADAARRQARRIVRDEAGLLVIELVEVLRDGD